MRDFHSLMIVFIGLPLAIITARALGVLAMRLSLLGRR